MNYLQLRTVLSPLCCRKPCSWEDIPTQSLRQLSAETIAAMQALEMRGVDGADDLHPLDDLFDMSDSEDRATPFVFLVEHWEDGVLQYYFVNTEGYSYMRYCFRIHPEDVDMLLRYECT